MDDLISLIITTYGADPSLLRAIRSVLDQTYKQFEIIVVDDNDKNTEQRYKTAQMMSAFKGQSNIKYIQHPENRNGSAARNTGISYAQGKYISFLDDDDILLPTRFEYAIKVMSDHPEYDGVCCDVVIMHSGLIGSIVSRPDGDIISYESFFDNYCLLGTGSNLFLKRDIVQKENGFDAVFNRFQDVEFMLRICKSGTVAWKSGISIIKDRSKVRKPDYKKVREAYTLFNERFSGELQSTSDDKKKRFETDMAGYLWRLAKLSRSKENILEQMDNAKIYDQLSLTDSFLSGNIDLFVRFLKLRFPLRNGRMYPLYTFAGKVRHYRKDILNRKLLTKEEVSLIKELMKKQ